MALADNLVSVWALDESSGNALDSFGTNTLTETSGTIDAATGKLSGARDFELGDTEYFTIADNASLSTGDIDWTFAVWVNMESLPAAATIAVKGNGSGFEWILDYVGGGTTRFRLRVFAAAGFGTNGTVQADNFGAPSTGTWYLITCGHDSVNNLVFIAVNAGTRNTSSYSSGSYDSTGAFFLGNDPFNAYYDGLLDEAIFWKRVITTTEATQLYNAGAGLAYPWRAGATTRGMPFGHRGTAFNGGRTLRGPLAC
jgi:hypothetical protein